MLQMTLHQQIMNFTWKNSSKGKSFYFKKKSKLIANEKLNLTKKLSTINLKNK